MTTANDNEAEEPNAKRDAQLRHALDLGLKHVGARACVEALLGALATLRQDEADEHAFEMAEIAIMALVHKNPAARDAAGRWHAQHRGCQPNELMIEVIDLQRQVQIVRRLYLRQEPRIWICVGPAHSPSYPTQPIGVSALAEFRSEYLVPRYGKASPSVKTMKAWFDLVDKPRSSRGLTVRGVVARILHRVRPQKLKRTTLETTVHRVDRVLRDHASRQK